MWKKTDSGSLTASSAKVLASAALFIVLVLTGLTSLVYMVQQEAPDFKDVAAGFKSTEFSLLDRDGALLQTIRTDKKKRRAAWVKISEVSPVMIRAVLRAEDQRFYTHSGVDFASVVGAFLGWVRGSGLRGASTVSMQLASMLNGSSGRRAKRRSPAQKMRQALSAWKLERAWTKDQILEAYLNLVYFRGELQGLGAAARGLFGRTPAALDEPQSLLLSAMLRSPSSSAEVLAGRACRLASPDENGRCDTVRVYASELSKRYELSEPGHAPHLARLLLSSGNSTVSSSVSINLQKAVQEALKTQLMSLHGRNVFDAAALVAGNDTGEVLAYVGNIPELSSGRYIDGVRAPRQAGSTLKPFLYALALESGILTPETLLSDTPLEISLPGGAYRPENYDHQYHGAVPVRVALASSLNIPAVRALKLAGISSFGSKLKNLGFSRIGEPEHYGYSLALGAPQVTLWELVNAYRTLANRGEHSELKLTGELSARNRRRVFPETAAQSISEILSDRDNRSLTFGLESVLATPFWSAVKTGTSKDMVDNWCVGYTSDYTIGVWIGNFSGRPMWNVSGVTGAAPAWAQIAALVQTADPASQRLQGRRTAQSLDSSRIVRTAEIHYPVNGAVFALDPDIPAANQKILFEAGAAANLRWELDGASLGSTTTPTPWQPVSGKHQLRLLGGGGEELDRVVFLVK